MLENLQVEDFSPILGAVAIVTIEDQAIELVLEEVVESRHDPPENSRRAFSLLLKVVDSEISSISQSIYPTKFSSWEEPLEIFLTPVMTGKQGLYLETIFT